VSQRAHAAHSLWWRYCSGDVKLYSDTSSIMPRQLVVELHTFEWVCVQYAWWFFASWKV